MPYGHPALTKFSKKMHAKVHKELKAFLRGIKKKLPNGDIVDMFPTKGNPGRRVIRNFSKNERTKALREFAKDFEGGDYFDNFKNELDILKEKDWLK